MTTTLTTREVSGTGATVKTSGPLSNSELDNNFLSLNDNKLEKSGGTMTGDIAMGTNAITGMADPTNAQDAATKAYVDAQISANNDLSEVLANGNTTGGTDLIVSAGDTLTADTINETTADNGVVIEGVTVKDGGITTTIDSTIYGLTVGRGAGAVSTNTAVGASALAANTTGAYNTAIGELALSSSDTAGGNTAVGQYALRYNTANGNVAVGGSAGQNKTTGAFNTFVGTSAGSQQTTAEDNTLVGHLSGGNITTGSYNVAIGQSAGYTTTYEPTQPPFLFRTGITTAAGCVIVGQEAGRYANGINTIVGYQSHSRNGIENATLGYRTLGYWYNPPYNVVGINSYNVAIGHQALSLANGVLNSVGVGYKALESASSGDNNTALGFQAGNSLTSGSNNIVIGYDADATSPTVSNETTIGNTSTTSARIFGDLKFLNSYTETVFAVSGTTPALSPANGTIQTWTLTATSTPTAAADWGTGQSMTLMVDDGSAYSISWFAVTWKTDVGAAPTLNTTGYTAIVLWKVGSTIYGARVGDA